MQMRKQRQHNMGNRNETQNGRYTHMFWKEEKGIYPKQPRSLQRKNKKFLLIILKKKKY
jgi:hypothetical protein